MLAKSISKRWFSVVKVEYTLNSARLRVDLPNSGYCWFFIDKTTTCNEFLTNCKQEDDSITTVALEGKPTEKPLFDLLEEGGVLKLKIDDIHHKVETVENTAAKLKCE